MKTIVKKPGVVCPEKYLTVDELKPGHMYILVNTGGLHGWSLGDVFISIKDEIINLEKSGGFADKGFMCGYNPTFRNLRPGEKVIVEFIGE